MCMDCLKDEGRVSYSCSGGFFLWEYKYIETMAKVKFCASYKILMVHLSLVMVHTA